MDVSLCPVRRIELKVLNIGEGERTITQWLQAVGRSQRVPTLNDKLN
jgi:hypothetical protein